MLRLFPGSASGQTSQSPLTRPTGNAFLMAPAPRPLTIHFWPGRRVDVINVTPCVDAASPGLLQHHDKALYYSYHTTGGFLGAALCNRPDWTPACAYRVLAPFRRLFPPGAGYRHDQLLLRTELSPKRRRTEPRNADAHLRFIGSGLESCVTHTGDPARPVYFVDLDGVNQDTGNRRRRRAKVIGYDDEATVARTTLQIPVADRPVDAVNLCDPDLGLFEHLHEMTARHGVTTGRVHLQLGPDERHAGLTVNEYEPLLMEHDLAEVLRNPLRFAARTEDTVRQAHRPLPNTAKHASARSRTIADDDEEDTPDVGDPPVAHIDKELSTGTRHPLRLKRSMSLLVTPEDASGRGTVELGRYQSPILLQWRTTDAQARRLRARLTRFE